MVGDYNIIVDVQCTCPHINLCKCVPITYYYNIRNLGHFVPQKHSYTSRLKIVNTQYIGRYNNNEYLFVPSHASHTTSYTKSYIHSRMSIFLT